MYQRKDNADMWAHLDDGREHEVQQAKWQRMLLQHLQVANRAELSRARKLAKLALADFD